MARKVHAAPRGHVALVSWTYLHAAPYLQLPRRKSMHVPAGLLPPSAAEVEPGVVCPACAPANPGLLLPQSSAAPFSYQPLLPLLWPLGLVRVC